SCCRGGSPHADGFDAAAYAHLQNVRLVIRQAALGDNLDVLEGRAVIELDKRESRFRVSPGSHPHADADLLADCLRLNRFLYRCSLHGCFLDKLIHLQTPHFLRTNSTPSRIVSKTCSTRSSALTRSLNSAIA